MPVRNPRISAQPHQLSRVGAGAGQRTGSCSPPTDGRSFGPARMSRGSGENEHLDWPGSRAALRRHPGGRDANSRTGGPVDGPTGRVAVRGLVVVITVLASVGLARRAHGDDVHGWLGAGLLPGARRPCGCLSVRPARAHARPGATAASRAGTPVGKAATPARLVVSGGSDRHGLVRRPRLRARRTVGPVLLGPGGPVDRFHGSPLLSTAVRG